MTLKRMLAVVYEITTAQNDDYCSNEKCPHFRLGSVKKNTAFCMIFGGADGRLAFTKVRGHSGPSFKRRDECIAAQIRHNDINWEGISKQ